jgi:hypothetical protein
MRARWNLFAFLLIVSPALFAQTAPPAAQQGNAPVVPKQSQAEWQRKYDMALKYKSLFEFYTAMQKEAASKPRMPLPDWSGIWTAETVDRFQDCLGGSQCYFRAAPGMTVGPKLTPVAIAELQHGHEMDAKGEIFDDNLSYCGPAGFPRWLTEPFMREEIVTPNETWVLTEQMNEIRRIYTDGRGHTPEADRYPLPEGDSIGFWDGQKLVIHTDELQSRPMGRNQPVQSEAMEAVEIWEKVNPNVIAIDVWVFDPRLYLEPWYVRRIYTLIPNPDKSLRVRYWDCSENANNDVIKTKDGATGYKGFTFDKSKN